MISAIIPTCDRPLDFLLTAIASAKAQTLAPSQIIVVDNGVNRVAADRLPEGVTLYQLPPRVGASRSRNFGAAMASGSYLAFLDDDDWWDPDFLRETWSVMQAEQTRAAYGRKDVFRHGQVQRYKCPTPATLTIPVLLNSNPGTGGQNFVVSKELFWRAGGFTENLRVSNDKAFAIDLLLTGEKVSIAPKAAAVLRVHDGPRLRHERLHRLRFIWRYRALYGPRRAITKSAGLIVKYTFHKLRRVIVRR